MPFILGISGPTNAGKSYFTKKLKKYCNEMGITESTVSTDDFYLDRSTISMEERRKINYDEPASISKKDFQNALKSLASGNSIRIQSYDFAQHNRIDEWRTVEPTDLIIIEGLFAFSFVDLLSYYDLKVYVDLEADLRLIRRLLRDKEQRGRNFDTTIAQYLKTIKPTQEKFVAKDKELADIILHGNKDHSKVIEMIAAYVKAKTFI